MKKKIIISFLGVDGSGKTTIIKKLKKKLLSRNIVISTFHLKPKLLNNSKDLGIIKNPHNQIFRSNFLSFIKLIQWLIIYRLYFVIKFFNSSNVYLFDRYADDILIDPIRYRFKLNQKLTRFLLSLFPRPNLWIILTGNPKKIWFRKKEIKLKVLKNLNQKYEQFGNSKKNLIFYRKEKDISKIEKNVLKLLR